MVTHQGLEDCSYLTQLEQADEFEAFIRNARISGGIIAVIALIVGGIGITNIMLASISERIREIGIRKAIGATTGAIFVQILIESLLISLLAGVAGLVASYGLIHTLSSLIPPDNIPVITVPAMAVACGFGVFSGVAASLFPAFKASRLHPIQALRYD